MANFLSTLLGPGEALGLCLGERTVRAVRVARSGEGFKLINSSSVEFSAGRSPHPSEVEEALRQISDLRAGERKRLVVNVPARLSRLYLFELPFDQPEKIRQVLGYSLEPFLMSKAEDLIFDYLPLQENRKGSPGIAFGAEPEAVSSALEGLHSAGLEPDVILPDSLGLVTAGQFLLREKTGIRLLLDLGAAQTSMVLYTAGRMASVRTLHYGGRNLTRKLAESLNMDMSEAEMLKHESALNSEESSPALKVLAEAWQPILREITRTLAAHTADPDGTRPILTLAGGGALTPGLPEFLNNTLGLEVEMLASEEADESRLSGLTPDMAPAAGLALAGLAPERPNLRRGEMAPTQALARYQRPLGFIAGGLLLAGIIGLGTLVLDYRHQNKRYEDTSEKIMEIFK
ncbi:MAG: pilus assembly protein PilM, partial [Deltaproteobacteria bacterium]|nr:pilus assembly protein PilM [Deltaproteobacteria bacterium]